MGRIEENQSALVATACSQSAGGFSFFRIDHVLGFYRVFGFPWRPAQNAEFAEMPQGEVERVTGGELPRFHPLADDTDAHRLSNRKHGEELLKVLVDETGPYALIGEDLGTVPDYVRPSLESLQIAGFRVPMWEKEWDTRLTPAIPTGGCRLQRMPRMIMSP
jgi:4-alpha-glucanotransferase